MLRGLLTRPRTQAMGANYFVWISVIIGVLALLSWVTGAI